MAQMVSEIAQGQQFQFSSGDGGGSPTASQTRVFKVLLSSPGELINLQDICGVYIGDPHPYNAGIFCTSYGAQFDGDSRMVIVVTFTYESVPDSAGGGGGGGGGSGGQPPDIRPANWTISSAVMEVPVRTWYPRTSATTWGASVPAANPVGDLYDGITAMRPVVTISITQFDLLDPTRHAKYVGSINSEEIKLGSLTMPPHTVMFRGLSVQSQVKPWGPRGVFRGWESSYEFAYQENIQSINFPGQSGFSRTPVSVGWDIAVPASGWNCLAITPAGVPDYIDAYGQPLKHEDYKIVDPLALPDGVSSGDKVRAMVKVFEYKSGGASQSPSSSPIPLNGDGRPLKVSDTVKPLVGAYQVHEAINITETLGLRLYGY